MAEISSRIQCSRDDGVAVKLLTIIHRDGMHPLLILIQHGNNHLRRIFGFKVYQLANQRILAFAFSKYH